MYTHDLPALLARYVPHHVSTCCHVSLHSLCCLDIDHVAKKERLAMLASEVARDDVVKVRQMSLAVLEQPSEIVAGSR